MADTVHETAILRHRQELSAESFDILINAFIEMIVESDNMLSNRAGLVQAMEDIGDCCTKEQCEKIFNAIKPLAMGNIQESDSFMSSREAANPLNPNKMNMGTPDDLQAISIFLLCCIERDQPGVLGRRLNPILENGLTNPNPKVRALAIAGAREKPNLSESEFAAIIFATRDADPSVANAAFGALANKTSLNLTRPKWRLFLHSVDLATRSTSAKIRRGASFACAKLAGQCTTATLKEKN